MSAVEKFVVCGGERTGESVRLNEDNVTREGVRREAGWPISDERILRGKFSGYNSMGVGVRQRQDLEEKEETWEAEEDEHF